MHAHSLANLVNRNRRQTTSKPFQGVVEPCNLEEPTSRDQPLVAWRIEIMEELLRATRGLRTKEKRLIVLPEFDESFSEAWERFKGMLRSCPHHGFSELTQVDTFYNGLTENEQDYLNSIGNVSKRNNYSLDERIDKLADQLSTLVEIVSKKVVTPAPIKAVEENCVTCGGAHAWKYAQIPTPVVLNQIRIPEITMTLPKSTSIPEPEIPKTAPKANIPYPSRRDNQKNREKASYQKEKIFQMFQDLRFDISFADALFLMPRYFWLITIRDLLMNKEKLLELAKIPLKRRMFDFIVVDFEADPRVPLILGRSFLKTGRTLIDVYEGEITLRVDNEAVTFNLDQTMKYSSTNDKSVNRIDIIDEICEEYIPELLGFPSDDFSSGNPTLTSELFTSEFTLEEIDAFLYDKSISLESDHDDCDPE
ncbi:hypothetical protein Tco_1272551 [Tanacetum coccineum]